MSAGHRAVEHTADLAFELWADDVPGLLVEAARAVVGVLTGGATPIADAERTFSLDAFDDEDRLVRWLNEVLYWALSEDFIVADADIERTAEGLRGVARGRSDGRELVATEIKSATYHDLVVRHEPGRVRAKVVMDV